MNKFAEASIQASKYGRINLSLFLISLTFVTAAYLTAS
ncbi:hypothetical protein HRED_00461 [Candidatus Haloredivivus sp. G17]|nr:hypothetical protein HRED_00461 [Candidatus Haloredivivus sp. G17]